MPAFIRQSLSSPSNHRAAGAFLILLAHAAASVTAK